jgi:hypothetical protein
MESPASPTDNNNKQYHHHGAASMKAANAISNNNNADVVLEGAQPHSISLISGNLAHNLLLKIANLTLRLFF